MITNDDIKKCARLARIKVDEKDLETMRLKLSSVMDMIDGLKEVNIENVKPLTSVLETSLRMRKDEITDKNLEEKLFANVPGSDKEFAKEIKCYIVPKVIE